MSSASFQSDFSTPNDPTLVPVSSARSEPTTKRGKSLLITIATYNEIENIPRLVDEVLKAMPEADLLVIDDNSPDGTGQWCDDNEDPRVQCLHREGKLGLGTAIIAGMKHAIENDYEFVLNMDADFSHHPRYLPDVFAGMQDAKGTPVDVMIGSRYVPGGAIEGWPPHRHVMSRGVNFYARCLLSLSPKDCSGAYRCYRTSTLAKLNFDEICSHGYSFQEEILWRLKRVGARFGETPITFADRTHGSSKIDRSEALSALRIIFSLGLKNWTGR